MAGWNSHVKYSSVFTFNEQARFIKRINSSISIYFLHENIN
jgi:hypothetical protein